MPETPAPAPKPTPAAAKASPTQPKTRRAVTPRTLARFLKDAGPYALALGIFAITAEFALNTTAAHYADELFTLALVLIRSTNTPPPAPPAA